VLPKITILNEDTRNITGLNVNVEFSINGGYYIDTMVIGNFDRIYGLELNAWNGTLTPQGWWEGNFLSLKYSGFDTEIDPSLLLFLNILFMIYSVGNAAVGVIDHELADAPSGGWKFSHLI
jgi:hypothetical protein